MNYDLSYHKITLRFRESELEKKYQQKLLKEEKQTYRISLMNSAVLLMFTGSLLFIINSQNVDDLSKILIAYCSIVYSFILIFIFGLSFMSNFNKKINKIKKIVKIYTIIIKL